MVTDQGICTAVNAIADPYSDDNGIKMVLDDINSLSFHKVRNNSGHGHLFQLQMLLDLGQVFSLLLDFY